ncbi:hypothetical protein [Sulfolobus acidocaldarius]|uniref:Uncharacterized protein n=2 Tax=Sulfolobus acidocaldarius TaxID=2285 RepID=M1J4H4_9CREN|nr:hypothetical protein [Sulfolobus acidocaldarius]AGE71844.1 hypothetical protein SacN8_09425 [Sulfolobus acidocaldarius N8]AGE74116.1 hypothetical protein SacRon12I_09445 [Sulfolobus acidocaldarius Ron12/I]
MLVEKSHLKVMKIAIPKLLSVNLPRTLKYKIMDGDQQMVR